MRCTGVRMGLYARVFNYVLLPADGRFTRGFCGCLGAGKPIRRGETGEWFRHVKPPQGPGMRQD